jgi:hypothetical protein
MNRGEILQTASDIITKDREQAYGSPEDNFQVIADFWNAYIGRKDITEGITAHDVAVMMCLLKIARMATGQPKPDNYIDLAGYAACGGEIATS